jgi:hypothetical protein
MLQCRYSLLALPTHVESHLRTHSGSNLLISDNAKLYISLLGSL